MTHRVLALALTVSLGCACGGSTESNAAGGGTAGSGGTSATGGSAGSGASAATGGTAGTGGTGGKPGKNSGDCDTDADCPGGKCVELMPGGYRVCQFPVQEATACQSPSTPMDQCCKSSDCATGKCYAFPVTPYCGGVMPVDHNVCASDGCELGKICPVGNETTGMCMPAGAYGYAVSGCVLQNCTHDTDCNAEPGGVCVPVENPCCGQPQGFFCSYPSDGCKKQSDCKPGQSCQPEYDPVRKQTVAHCKDGMIGCPA